MLAFQISLSRQEAMPAPSPSWIWDFTTVGLKYNLFSQNAEVLNSGADARERIPILDDTPLYIVNTVTPKKDNILSIPIPKSTTGRIYRFIVREQGDSGSFGTIIKGTIDGKGVALKRMAVRVENIADYSAFVKETVLHTYLYIQSLQIHAKPAAVLPLFAVFRSGVVRNGYECFYMLMEEAKEDLGGYLEKHPTQLANKLYQVATYLEEYESVINYTHKDLKFNNIMIDKNGAPRIIDFGYSELTTSTRPRVMIQTKSEYGPSNTWRDLSFLIASILIFHPAVYISNKDLMNYFIEGSPALKDIVKNPPTIAWRLIYPFFFRNDLRPNERTIPTNVLSYLEKIGTNTNASILPSPSPLPVFYFYAVYYENDEDVDDKNEVESYYVATKNTFQYLTGLPKETLENEHYKRLVKSWYENISKFEAAIPRTPKIEEAIRARNAARAAGAAARNTDRAAVVRTAAAPSAAAAAAPAARAAAAPAAPAPAAPAPAARAADPSGWAALKVPGVYQPPIYKATLQTTKYKGTFPVSVQWNDGNVKLIQVLPTWRGIFTLRKDGPDTLSFPKGTVYSGEYEDTHSGGGDPDSPIMVYSDVCKESFCGKGLLLSMCFAWIPGLKGGKQSRLRLRQKQTKRKRHTKKGSHQKKYKQTRRMKGGMREIPMAGPVFDYDLPSFYSYDYFLSTSAEHIFDFFRFDVLASESQTRMESLLTDLCYVELRDPLILKSLLGAKNLDVVIAILKEKRIHPEEVQKEFERTISYTSGTIEQVKEPSEIIRAYLSEPNRRLSLGLLRQLISMDTSFDESRLGKFVEFYLECSPELRQELVEGNSSGSESF